MLLGNDGVRDLWQHLYDDAFASFYVTLAIYFFVFKRVYVAAVFFMLAISVKAGVGAILPILFGTI
jgi:predicted membrane-bound dolichyl-phosphate-mannose-protein mannosyltransferase